MLIHVVEAQYNPREIESSIMEFWEEIDAYSKVRELRRGGEKFFFVDGPPYTTGRVHLGTAWNKVIKDTILRFKSMKGFHVRDRAGWDMHGLPIEVKVEGVLGFKSKKDIESYGVDKFIAKCKEFALSHKDEMTAQFKSLGVWLNWKDPYMTLRDEYIEAAWWTLKQAHNKNLLEQGMRVVNWCPRCETAIADSEVDYSDETDPSIYVKFPLSHRDGEFIVIWTTTPWTIPANIAVAVHPSFEYARVEAVKDGRKEVLIIARELVEQVLRAGRYTDYRILDTMLGEELAGTSYEHPLKDKIPKQKDFPHQVYMADFVTAENTGCVHIAPGHGVDDFLLGVEHNLPVFCPVDSSGVYTEEAGEYAGLKVREANDIVTSDLEERGLLLASGRITHRYGHCWRCNTSIIYRATEQWFLRVSQIKEAMLEEIEKVEWYPEWAGSARFHDWISSARDWCISRQRYWGIPIPVWICESCGSLEVIGSSDELKKRANLSELEELHRPYVDKIQLPCEECGGKKHRVKDVFDVWFDSAVASWATLGFPKNREEFDQWWPADFITEGHDQTRGWFYSQLGASMIAFERAPYKSVLMHGFTLDEAGRKMSKNLGNVVSPEEVVERFGAETLRYYVLSSSAPWDDLKFGWGEVANVHRMFNILWNVYRFPLPYMVLDNFDPKKTTYESIKHALRPEDRWMLSRIQTLAQTVDEEMSEYELHKATRAISEFILDDLSRWYIQLIRPRVWIEADNPDKLAAYWVLHRILSDLSKIIAPFSPFLAETIYQNIVRKTDASAPESVHMCNWIEDTSMQNLELEEQMNIARDIVEATSNARQKAKRKLRWPIRRIIIKPHNQETVKAVKALRKVILEQCNSKDLLLLNVDEEWSELGVKVIPKPAVIGPVFKQNAGKVIKALEKANNIAIKHSINTQGRFEIPELDVTVLPEMVEFKEVLPKNTTVAEFPNGVVYVDSTLTRNIEAEGYAREIIRRLQDMRKELNLNVEDEIRAVVNINDERITDLVLEWEEFIAHEVRTKILVIGMDVEVKGALVKEWNVEGIQMTMGISK
jgi:isoleucyl-tRNA synthetase